MLCGYSQSGKGGVPSPSTHTPAYRATHPQGFSQAAGVKFSITPTRCVQPPDTTPPPTLPPNAGRGFLPSLRLLQH